MKATFPFIRNLSPNTSRVGKSYPRFTPVEIGTSVTSRRFARLKAPAGKRTTAPVGGSSPVAEAGIWSTQQGKASAKRAPSRGGEGRNVKEKRKPLRVRGPGHKSVTERAKGEP